MFRGLSYYMGEGDLQTKKHLADNGKDTSQLKFGHCKQKIGTPLLYAF